jgi:hypothetical protein
VVPTAPVKKLSAPGLLAIGLVVFTIYGFPGLMTIDSFDQLAEARKNYYTDGHPPAMAFLWRWVDLIIAGPLGMLVIQGATFLIGVWLILRRVMSDRRAAVVATVLLLIPQTSTTMIIIWKDCLMAGFFMLGIGLVLDDRRKVRIAGLVVMSIATSFRYNAPAGTLPLVLILFVWEPGLHWLKRYGIAFGAWVAITVAAWGCNRALTDNSVNYWYSSAAVADIVGTLRHVDRDIPDDEMKKLLAGCPLTVHENIHQKMREYYEPWNFLFLVVPGPKQMFDLPLDRNPPAEHQAAMKAAWQRVITGNLGAYFKHRWWTFREVLGLTRHPPWGSAIRHHDQHGGRLAELGIGSRASWMQVTLQRAVAWFTFKTKMMRPWLYMVMALLLLPMCRGNRDAFALLVSGLVLEASLYPTALTPDLRYSHWGIVCAILAAIILFTRRVRR